MNESGPDQILASLRAWGVPYLDSPAGAEIASPMKPDQIAAALIASSAPRLRLAVIAFYLRRPEQAASVQQALKTLDTRNARLLKYYYTAAVYLERYWKSALNRGPRPPMPDYFSAALGLPSPSILHGRLGLFYLEEKLRQETGEPLDFRSGFDAIARLQFDMAHA